MDRYLNLGRLKYEAGVLTTLPQLSVIPLYVTVQLCIIFGFEYVKNLCLSPCVMLWLKF